MKNHLTDAPACPWFVAGLWRALRRTWLVAVPSLAVASEVARWGTGTVVYYSIPPELTNAVSLSGGTDHAVALKADGAAVAWGYGPEGQAEVPASLSNVVQITAGWHHSLALKADGTVVAWGWQRERVPPDLDQVIAVAAADYSLALKTDGTVRGWGFGLDTAIVQPPPSLGGLRAITAGAQHALGIKHDGTVVAWGNDSFHVTDVPPGLTNVVAVAAGFSHSVALKSDGTVVAWGNNWVGQTNVPPGLSNVVAIACSSRDRFSLALKSDGTLVTWGEAPRLPALGRAVSIGAGHDCGLAVLDDLRGTPEVQPVQLTAYTGRRTMLTLCPVLCLPSAYQWQLEGADVPGATNSTLVLPHLEGSDAGHYRVVLTTPSGPIVSRPGELRVVDGSPWIITPPENHLGYQGEPVTFRVTVGGSGPFDCQWRFGNEDLVGANEERLTLAGIMPADAGPYSVRVRNAFGSGVSAPALLEVAQLWSWGDNDRGQVRNDARLRDVVAMAAGSGLSLALRRDGTVAAWGQYEGEGGPGMPPDLGGVVAIAAGREHALALKADGTVVAWGDGFGGKTAVPEGLSNVVRIAAGAVHSMALRADGRLVAWGMNQRGESSVPIFLQDVVAIAARNLVNLALHANGRVFAWGDNWAHQCDVPADLTNAVAITLGGDFALALTDGGKVVAWGDGAQVEGSLGGMEGVIAVAAGGRHQMALRADGTVVTAGSFYDPWEDNDAIPAETPPGMTNIVAIAAAGIHSMALAGEGPPFITAQPLSRLVVPGNRTYFRVEATGQRHLSYQWQFRGVDLPDATNATLILPRVGPEHAGAYRVVVRNPAGTVWSSEARLELGVLPRLFQWERAIEQTSLPSNLSRLIDVALSLEHGLALGRDGMVSTWGANHRGQASVPAGLANVVAVAAGATHSLALRADGMVIAWGDNFYGQTKVPAGLKEVVAIAAGWNHNLALRTDGTVVAWGDGSNGQTNLPRDDDDALLTTNVIAIAAGEDRSLALRADGTVVAWGGDGDYGDARPPVGLAEVVAIACGTHDAVALRRDGTAVAWGDLNPSPQEIPGGEALANSFLASFFYRGSNGPGGLGPGDLSTLVAVQPARVIAYTGRSVRFSAMAFGLAPLSYRWRFNGQDIPDATNSHLILRDVQGTNWGNYTVAVESPFGPIGEATAELTVTSGPTVFLREPGNSTAYTGGEALLEVETDGTGPCSYQWFREGDALPGATNSFLRLVSVAPDQAGEYWVEVSNHYGVVRSRTARLEVVPQQVFAWGDNRHGQTMIPAGLTNIVALAGDSYHSLALRADGQLAGWGYFVNPMAPEGLSNIVAVSCGAAHTLALLEAGTVVAWGSDYYGQTRVPAGLSNVVAIAAGDSHNLALKDDGTVVVWGGDVPVRQAPLPAGLTNVAAVAAGYYHSLALRRDGTVLSWGWNRDGETDTPAGLDQVVAVAGGYNYSLALKSDGRVVFWGDRRGVRTNVFAGEGRIVAIASGTSYYLGLRDNGTVVAGGQGDDGQTQVPTGLTSVVQIAAGRYHGLALVAPSPVLPGPRLSQPSLERGRFRVWVATARGKAYTLEFKDSLEPGWWTPLPPLPGNGLERELSDPNCAEEARFYRVRLLP